MRAAPVAGRLFSPEEEKPNGANAALVSSAFARSHYGEIHSALGRVLRIASQSFPITVFSVMISITRFAAPQRQTSGFRRHGSARIRVVQAQNYRAIARLKPGMISSMRRRR